MKRYHLEAFHRNHCVLHDDLSWIKKEYLKIGYNIINKFIVVEGIEKFHYTGLKTIPFTNIIIEFRSIWKYVMPQHRNERCLPFEIIPLREEIKIDGKMREVTGGLYGIILKWRFWRMSITW